jgi:hypothetical protein
MVLGKKARELVWNKQLKKETATYIKAKQSNEESKKQRESEKDLGFAAKTCLRFKAYIFLSNFYDFTEVWSIKRNVIYDIKYKR